MKITCNRNELIASLSWMAGSTSSKGALGSVPHLVKLTSTQGEVTLFRTDLETFTTVTLASSISDVDTTVATSALLLLLTAKAMRGDDLVLSTDGKRNAIEVVAGRGRASLPIVGTADIPDCPDVTGDAGKTDGNAFAAALNSAARFAATGLIVEQRSVGLAVADDLLIVRGSDGYRACEIELPYSDGAPFAGAISQSAVTKVAAAVADQTVEVAASEFLLRITAGQRTLTTRLVTQPKFPTPEQMTPPEVSDRVHALDIDVDALTDLATRASALSEEAHEMRLLFDDGALTMSSTTAETAEIADMVEIDWPHREFRLVVNPRYLLDALGALGSPTARLVTPKMSKLPTYFVAPGVTSIIAPKRDKWAEETD